MELRAVSPPGLESVLARELAALGLAAPARYLRASDRRGDAAFEGDLASVMRANLWLRTAERVFVRVARFPARTWEELERGLRATRWDGFAGPGRRVLVRAKCRASKLHHEKAVAERAAAVIGQPEGADEETSQLIVVRVEDDQVSVDLDSSGAPLHRRGWRLETAKAPLRETLAAALVLAGGWDPSTPLLDPFCGSGTIAIEAALLSRRMAPGRARRFSFMEWPCFDEALWQRLLSQAAAGELRSGPPIRGSDRDAGAVEISRANAERAGVSSAVEFSRAAVSAAEPPPGVGALVTNPPYGLRVTGAGDPRDVYSQLGKLVVAKAAGWKVALVCPDESLARATGLSLTPGPSTKNGGLDVRFWLSR